MAQPNSSDTVVCSSQAGSVTRPARSTPRVEKGVHKVNEHAVRERASKYLYALAKMADSLDESEKERKVILDRIKEDIDRTVADFGLNKERMVAESEGYITDIKRDISRIDGIEELQVACSVLSGLVDGVSKAARAGDDMLQVDAAKDSANLGLGLASGRKRVREEISQIESVLHRVNSSVKRIKEANENNGRRSSSRRKSEDD